VPESGFSSRGAAKKTDEDKRHFLAEATAPTTKQKTSLEKLQFYFVSMYFFQIDTFINSY
jgi:hypothetical protein